jgi:YD repeat-containing protein
MVPHDTMRALAQLRCERCSRLFAAGAILACVAILLALPATARADIFYLYDETGRLSAVIDHEGNAATYSYDLVGNLLAIERVNAGDQPGPVAITLVRPNRGKVGAEVTIFGKGFSATPSENTVAFHGTNATVTAAAANRLVTTVPSGATTGSITVTSPLGTATSPSPFTVGGAIAVEPGIAALVTKASLQFQATEDSTPTTAVTWAVNGIAGGDASIGTISSSGIFTAPAFVPLGSTVTVTATQQDDPQARGSASVTVVGKGALINTVSVKVGAPAQTINQNIGAVVSVRPAEPATQLVVGSLVAATVAPPATQVLAAAGVTATVAPVITGRSPTSGARGATNLAITVTGSGFTGATALSFRLAGGADSNVTVTNLQIDPGGAQATAQISISSGAAVGDRVLQITTPSGASTAAGTGGNVFTVQ